MYFFVKSQRQTFDMQELPDDLKNIVNKLRGIQTPKIYLKTLMISAGDPITFSKTNMYTSVKYFFQAFI